METATATPMLKQYLEIKSRHQDAILFFRLGDFYEMFFDDAKIASRILDLVLTSRGQESTGKIPMCGVPFHSAEQYIARLIKAGQKVAICEQTEDPATTKGLVKRDVTRIVTAGTYLDESTESRFIVSLIFHDHRLGIAIHDSCSGIISTNEFNSHDAIHVLSKLPVYECVFPQSQEEQIQEWLKQPSLMSSWKNVCLSPFGDWAFHSDLSTKSLTQHFAVHSLKGFGVHDLPLAIGASGAMLEYLRSISKKPLSHIHQLALYDHGSYVYVSPAAHYGLEMESLLKTLDGTLTPMGRRLFRFWLYHPLVESKAIILRQEAAQVFLNQSQLLESTQQCLRHLPDVQKALSRLSTGSHAFKDIMSIRQSLLRTPLIKESLNLINHPLLKLNDLIALRENLQKTINPDAPLSKPDGQIIQKGIDQELDELRDILENGKQWLAEYQTKECQRTGINSLKVGFNNVFGFYIEISKANQKLVPSDYIRKQTLVNGERYITDALKTYESKFLNAQDKILSIERRILATIEEDILKHSEELNEWCDQIATIDCLMSFALLAQWPNYIFPKITEDTLIDIQDGRHPVVEKNVPDGFIPNDTRINTSDLHLIILTGPNMAGKSTYIRQTAILVIMAQMGAPIPASKASCGLVDKIFTRIGAHDDIAKGQSTFMVEMTETADILNNLTPRSLVILDEIGRGTSTSDGLSLAWALAEHMHHTKTRTLFATHFHELIALEHTHQGIFNCNVSVKKWQDKIIFMHKIVPGGSDDSYGIYVAKLAGIPNKIILRSKELLQQIEKGQTDFHLNKQQQLHLFEKVETKDHTPLFDTIASVDINQLTPLQALEKLAQIKDLYESR